MLYFAFVGGPFCKIFLKSVQATIGDGIVPPISSLERLVICPQKAFLLESSENRI